MATAFHERPGNHTATKEKIELPENVKIDHGEICARYYCGKLHLSSVGPASPMAGVEPQLIELLARMSRMRRCLTATRCLFLANDLIKGTEIDDEVIAFKKGRKNQLSLFLEQNIEKKSRKGGNTYSHLKESRNLH